MTMSGVRSKLVSFLDKGRNSRAAVYGPAASHSLGIAIWLYAFLAIKRFCSISNHAMWSFTRMKSSEYSIIRLQQVIRQNAQKMG